METDYFNLFGISMSVSGDIDKGRALVGEAARYTQCVDRDNVQGLDFVEGRMTLSSGATIHSTILFGAKRAHIHVPPVLEEAEPSGKRIEEEKMIVNSIIPAFEVYSTPEFWSSSSEFLGIVLCRGGGFNPPYEFIKKDFLPDDWQGNYPYEEMPEERKWWEYDYQPGKDRMFEDLIPEGKEQVSFEQGEQTGAGQSSTAEYIELVTARAWPSKIDESWKSQTCPKFHCEMTKDFGNDYFFEFYPDGLPTERLIINDSFSNRYGGEGECTYTMVSYTASIVFGDTPEEAEANSFAAAVAWLNDGHYVSTGPTNWEESLPAAMLEVPPILSGEYDYTYSSAFRRAGEYDSSVKDKDEYALVYQPLVQTSNTEYHRRIPSFEECARPSTIADPACTAEGSYVSNENETYEPTRIVLDGVVFEIGGDLNPYTEIRYYQVGDRHVGLFFLRCPHLEKGEVRYVMAEINPEKQEAIVTYMNEEITDYPTNYGVSHPVPGVEYKGDPVYSRGTFRLVRETIFETKITEEDT